MKKYQEILQEYIKYLNGECSKNWINQHEMLISKWKKNTKKLIEQKQFIRGSLIYIQN